MLPQEKVADAIFKWEKYARTTRSQKELKLTFKVNTIIVPVRFHLELFIETLIPETVH